ncbi:MAG TPA: transcriptional repressor LexA, partial [Abditibacteriaceae bacterium]|nr:transcriptional repressor LexA [Abditibacteriaceae bacterium]
FAPAVGYELQHLILSRRQRVHRAKNPFEYSIRRIVRFYDAPYRVLERTFCAMNMLTPRQNQVLQLVADCWREGFAPVVSELAQRLGLAGQSSVTPILEALQRKGFIEIHGGVRGRQRQIVLTTRGKVQTHAQGLPVVGCIRAGPLSEALQMANVFVDSVDLLLPFQADDFLLQVDGDSMIGDGILAGDRVLMRPNVAPQNGEIVAVHVGEDYCATLKHIFFQPESEMVELRASNEKYEPILVRGDEVKIAGVFRGLVRTMESWPTSPESSTR